MITSSYGNKFEWSLIFIIELGNERKSQFGNFYVVITYSSNFIFPIGVEKRS
jgi:hypothetical protein